MSATILHVVGLALTWLTWLWLAGRQDSPSVCLALAIGGILALIPLVLVGRRLLDLQPTPQRAVWVTAVVHYLVAIFMGSAIIEAVRFGLNSTAWPIPLSPWLGLPLIALSGLALLAVIFNLLLKGFGAPFAVALTRVVVTDWLYAWTRNPMVLSALALLVGLGIWMRSGLFLVWVLAVLSPAAWIFLKVYEERELEVRFGKSYLEYKARTPMMIPRRPPGRPS